MSSQDFPYFQKSKKILHSHWLRAVSIHLKSVSIWGFYRYEVTKDNIGKGQWKDAKYSFPSMQNYH